MRIGRRSLIKSVPDYTLVTYLLQIKIIEKFCDVKKIYL